MEYNCIIWKELATILIEDYNVAVIPCADFGFEDHIRLSYAISMDQIAKGLDRIEQFVTDVQAEDVKAC